MCRPSVSKAMLAGHIIRLLESEGSMTVPDICHNLRKRHGIDFSSVELGSAVIHNPYLRGRIARTTKWFGRHGGETTDTYYHLVMGDAEPKV